ncbi:MAG: hypothetical protein EOO78_30520, partial [Oxalobacteraceae bacterium]
MNTATAITEQEFGRFQRFIFEAAGISISSGKKAMLCGRLGKRLREHRFSNYTQYLQLLESARAAPNLYVMLGHGFT